MLSLRFGKLLRSTGLFILPAILVPVLAVAAEPATGEAPTAEEVETTATGTGPSTWDKTREVSSETWDATKAGSAKAWDKTREVSGEAWDATKAGSAKAWDKTREVSGEAWDKTRGLTQHDAEATEETEPQP
jgi:hypothetical protein